MPGPKKQFPAVQSIQFTEEQSAHLRRLAALTGMSVGGVVRAVVQDLVDRAHGDDAPLPSVEEMVLHGFPLEQVAHLLPPAPQPDYEKE